ncbi:MAG TPA: HTTM domain-containing protein [Pyrinomonadaceae bacterium]|nr:HTTM domain-containing protein [Pyrinomonadaceae bacterium]
MAGTRPRTHFGNKPAGIPGYLLLPYAIPHTALSEDNLRPTTASAEPESGPSDPGDHSQNPTEHSRTVSTVSKIGRKTRSALFSRVGEKIEELFSIDLRSLALTRITTGLLVLVDLIWRASSLTAFYSDRGLVPRSAVFQNFPNSWISSLHLMNGRPEIQALLFAISGALALLLVAGYRTRLVSFWIWLLVTSLNSRNLYVIHGGDSILNMLLFWGMFVPWGAKYSVDHALDSTAKALPSRLLSIGTAALILQMPLVYFFSGILKNGPEWRYDFTAIYYAITAPDYATFIGHWMASWPMSILKAFTASTLVLELAGALLLFSPVANRTIRSVVLPAFVLLQLGLGLTMRLGLFPLISTVGILPFISSRFWDTLLSRFRTPSSTGLRIYYDRDCSFCRKSVLLLREFCLWPDTYVEAAQDAPSIHADMQSHNSWVLVDYQDRRHFKFEALTYLLSQSPVFWLLGHVLGRPAFRNAGDALYEGVANNRSLFTWLVRPLKYRPLKLSQSTFCSLLCAFFLAYVVLDNLGSIKRARLRVPEQLGGIGQMLRIHQSWRMFAPAPLKVYDWYLVEGRLLDGQAICLVNGALANCGHANHDVPLLRNYRWRTYWRWAGTEGEKRLRPDLGRYLCHSWNNSHPGAAALDTLAIYKVRQTLPLDKSTEPERIELWRGECSPKGGFDGSDTDSQQAPEK